jgi:hypothetical protein
MLVPASLSYDAADVPERRNTIGVPPWRGKVSDDDLKLLWDYVQSGG